MPRILFSLSNIKKIDSDVQNVCFTYNQLKESSLQKITLLDAFSLIYGYKNWGHLNAVNKENRPYIPFSFSVSSHVRTIISELSRLTLVDPLILMVSVTLVELGVKDVTHIHLIECERKHCIPAFSAGFEGVNSTENMLWFTDNYTKPERFLACHPTAARISRRGIILSDFLELFPELGSWLNKQFLLDDEFVLMFNHSEWWYYNDIFTRSERLTAKFEIHIRQKERIRVCYHPLYCDKGSGLYDEIAQVFAEGMPYCPSIRDIDEGLSDYDYVIACWKIWEQQKHIEKITLTVNRPQWSFYVGLLPAEKLQILDLNIDPLFEEASRTDFTNEIYAWEPRYTYSHGKVVIESELWVKKADINTFLRVNERIHARLNELSKRTDMMRGKNYLDAFKKEKYTARFL